MRQVDAEADHLGIDVVSVWWEACPARVRAELAARMLRWADSGLLTHGTDPDRATVHFSLLVSAGPGPRPRPTAEKDAWIEAGVRAFLHGYAQPQGHGVPGAPG